MNREEYQSPFSIRYASKEMRYLFSDQYRYMNWRKLWLELAKAQKSVGANISDEQIKQLEEHLSDIDFEKVREYEKEFRHDVMAHIHAYCDVAPLSAPIIHLGATSAFVGDNGDQITMKAALELIEKRLLSVMKNLRDFSLKHKDLPTMGYTHFQPAQLTTVGKRSSLWLFDFYMDYEQIQFAKDQLYFRGVKGTTGTQDSYMNIFKDEQKVKLLDQKLKEAFGFKKLQPVTGQTYSRKMDSIVLDTLKSIASSAHKMTNDLRLLQHTREFNEDFAKNQVGSSAMAYKRNPMKSERTASLAKYCMSIANNATFVHSTQWFERTLDDSANRRLSLSEGFLCCDSILTLLENLTRLMEIHPKIIEQNIQKQLPFMITEHLIIEGVKRGGSRQDLHESIRQHAIYAQREMQEGRENPFLESLLADKSIPLDESSLEKLLDPKLYTGRSSQQVEEFIQEMIDPILQGKQFVENEVEI